MRLIDADELKKKAVWIEERGGFSTLSIEIDDIRRAPTVDAVPVVHGRWVANEFGYSCSICGCNSKLPLPYDAYCGAKW